MRAGLKRARRFEPEAWAGAGETLRLTLLDEAEERRASLVAELAAQLLAGTLANPSCYGPLDEVAEDMLRVAVRLEAAARRLVVEPTCADALLRGSVRTASPSPQARAWGAGYRDAENGQSYSFRGPGELEADYWDGYTSAEAERRRKVG